jgi:hypothetical protein
VSASLAGEPWSHSVRSWWHCLEPDQHCATVAHVQLLQGSPCCLCCPRCFADLPTACAVAELPADYESPWEEPKPAPPSVNLLVGSTAACTGAAAASNPACKALQSAAPTAVLSQLLAVLVLLLVVVLG